MTSLSSTKRFVVSMIAAAALTFAASAAVACTSMVFRAQDGTPIYARTMEWGVSDLKSEMMSIPRNYAFKSMLTGGKTGMTWSGRYGFVGITPGGGLFATDGMNEEGLTVGVLFYPGFAEYQSDDASQDAKSIAVVDVANYLLSSFKTVGEIRAGLPNVRVVRNSDIEKEFGAALPLHFVATDASGASLVIEYTAGKLTLFDNKVGVMTNSPNYDWHLLNLRNYANLKPNGAPPRSIDGVSLAPFGAGSGMLGLPGDFTPPSRFVRAVAFVNTMAPVKDATEGVEAASAMLNNFDIPKGLVNEGTDKAAALSFTQWFVVGDTRHKVYYYWTAYNRRMRRVDLTKLSFTGTKAVTFPLDAQRVQDIEDRTADLSH